MLEEFGRAGFLLVFALAFPILPLAASVAFGAFKIRPRRPDPIKTATYECGVETEGDALGQFNVRYYVFALLFVIFEVEAVLFVAILLVGYVYAWRRKALEWL